MNKRLKYFPQSILMSIVIFGLFLIFNSLIEKHTKIEELHWILIIFLKLTMVISLAALLNFGKEIRIKKFKLIKGNYNVIFGFIKIDKQFSIDSITDVVIVQNSKEYFEIKVLTADDEMIIDTFPNSNPAKIELKKIEQIIKTAANSRLAPLRL